MASTYDIRNANGFLVIDNKLIGNYAKRKVPLSAIDINVMAPVVNADFVYSMQIKNINTGEVLMPYTLCSLLSFDGIDGANNPATFEAYIDGIQAGDSAALLSVLQDTQSIEGQTRTAVQGLNTKAPALGSAVTAASIPVNVASDQIINTNPIVGTTPYRRVSTGAGADKTLVIAGAKKLTWVYPLNMVAVAALAYLKIYDAATALSVTVGTTIPILTIQIPVAAVGVSIPPIPIPEGLNFASGIVIAITTGGADSNATAVAAGDVIVQLAYK